MKSINTKIILGVAVVALMAVAGAVLFMPYGKDNEKSKISISSTQPNTSRPVSTVQSVNKEVAALEEEILSGGLSLLVLDIHTPSLEAVPPKTELYSRGDNLAVAFLSIGHETWATRRSFYFYSTGEPMKYVREILGAEEYLEDFISAGGTLKQEIIFDYDGTPIWSNVDNTQTEEAEILQEFFSVKKFFSLTKNSVYELY